MLYDKSSISVEMLKDTICDAMQSGDATLRCVAARLGTSPRSLQRQLEIHTITYSDVVDEVRYEIARTLLASTDIDIAEVGAMLGYRDPSSFSRAFMRWSGTSPKQYRASHQAQSEAPHDRSQTLDHALERFCVGRLSANRNMS